MKVYQLMSALEQLPAGADVCVQRGPGCFAVTLESVSDDGQPDYVTLIGDGTEPGNGEAKP